MKKFILLLANLTVSSSVIAAQFECENSGRITYQDEACNAAQCMNLEQPTDLINLFDKISIGQLAVQKGKISSESTDLSFEVNAINESKNRVKLTLKYDGVDKDGYPLDTQTLYGTLEGNTKIKIKSSSYGNYKKTALLNKIVRWQFSGWSAEINK